MITVIRCKNCGKEHNLSIELSFTPKFQFCEACGSSRCPKWSFHFCDPKCFFEWMKKNKIEKLGFPCQDCVRNNEPTGFFAGFKENGGCKTCQGKKRVKASKIFLPRKSILM